MAESLNKKKATHPDSADAVAARNESVTIADIEKLFSLMRENEIAELEIEQFKTKIHIVSKGAPQAVQAPAMMQYMPGMQPIAAPQNQGSAPPPAPAAAPAETAPSAEPADPNALPANARTILSPMVGTFYSSPSPDSPVFVKEGDTINDDTVLCIIEAMKLMNEIKAETRGKIVRVLVENGMPVEFNQPLFLLES